jgi:hypothetical protein
MAMQFWVLAALIWVFAAEIRWLGRHRVCFVIGGG